MYHFEFGSCARTPQENLPISLYTCIRTFGPRMGLPNHLIRNVTIIVRYSIYQNRFLYPLEWNLFCVTLWYWQLIPKTTGNLSISKDIRMLRPHGGPQNHLLLNATIIVMFRMYLNRFLYPFELNVFGVTLRIWQLRSNTIGKSSHFLIYPYGWTPYGSPKPFVTECHHNSYVPYVS